MSRSYSTTEARNRFARIVRELEHTQLVQVTRRGKPVAVLLSIREYDRMRPSAESFWAAYEGFRTDHDLAALRIEPALFDGVRDKSPGREVEW